ncbi:Hypp6731 [Branchiostoma lanceolatum]|uniref:Hypp6731 protein n=1 Tax=Branchiostoma lanceolatum TaxID=7740 RepID=A0A8K0E7F4_BRALA|nr:Hypp6731 [Branchiostoma lanceolatum]
MPCTWVPGLHMSSEFYLSGRESDLELGFASLFGDLRLDSPPNIYLHGFVGTATAMNLTDSVSSEFYLSGRESDLELGFASLFGDWRLDSPPNSLDFSRQRHREPPSASLSSRDQDILIRRQASRMESGGVGTKSHVCVLCRNDVSAVACDGRGGAHHPKYRPQNTNQLPNFKTLKTTRARPSLSALTCPSRWETTPPLTYCKCL